MRASTRARGPSSRILRARAGVASLASSRRGGGTGVVTMVAALPPHSRASAHGGGGLEHPAYSAAWRAFDLPAPPRHGGWVRGLCGGWSCHVEQSRYGHPAKKATWLYAFGCDLPSLRWGSNLDQKSEALVSWCGNRVASGERRPRVGKAVASRTPLPFRDVLIAMAESANTRRVAT